MDAPGVAGGDGERAVLPAQQVGVEGGQQARGIASGAGSRAARSTRSSSRSASSEAIACSPARASRSGRPLQAARSAGGGRAVGGEVAAGELGQRGVAIGARELGAAPSQSRASAKAWAPSSRSGPSTTIPRSAASMSRCGVAWPSVRMPLAAMRCGQLGAGERARVGERALDDRHRALGVAAARRPPGRGAGGSCASAWAP